MSKVDENGKRVKTGGRAKGTPNKRTKAIQDKLDELDCDPFKILADIAMDITAETNVRVTAAKELAQYIAPKRKAVEVTGEGGDPLQIVLKQYA